MKSLVFLASLVMAGNAFAAEVKSAKYNAAKKGIEIGVKYGGGCKEHKFELQVGTCLESFPVQCSAELVDLTNDDFCEALVSRTIFISLDNAGLNESYYSSATINIKGDNQSRVAVRLPRF